MKPLADLDHYEVLEIPRGMPREGIERAYQLAMATYADDSLAGYSVFDSGDAAVMRERIETAYRVLSDPVARAAYDAELVGEPAAEPSATAPSSVQSDVHADPEDELEELESEDYEIDGSWLRRSRLRRGLDLEAIAGVTKINPSYLRFLEEERYGDLPAPVYVRGFVTAYASCLGVDPRRVASSYMKRYEDQRSDDPRGRFF